MSRPKERRSKARVLAAALAALLGSTAVRAGDHLPAETPAPLGEAMHGIFRAQWDAARQDHYVFYELEWLRNTPLLGPAGRLHLARVAHTLANAKYPVIIEAHPDPGVNMARRATIVAALVEAGVPNADARVIVGQPLAEGLYGEEAVMLYPALITTRFHTGLIGRGLGGFGGGLGGLGGIGGLGGLGLGGGYGFGGGYGYGGGYGGYGGGYGGYGGVTPATGFRGLGY